MNALQEALKEAARTVLISIIPLVVVGLQDGSFDYRFIGVTATITFLRFADKWLHEWGKETNNEVAQRGLTQF